MVTLADSLLSSSARRTPIRKRPDLSARKQHYLGKTYWVVKEPVGLNYFRFQEEEYAILDMLDGQTSLDEIKERFEAEFPPQKITLEELHQFLGMLHRSGLVISAVPGQGQELFKRRGERKRQQFLAAITNVLSLRFKGFDPERFLEWLEPKVGWVFEPLTVICVLLFALSALSLVLVEFDVFRSKLPEFHQFFTAKNAFWLAVVLGVTKIFHEFGHGLSCKHFGGECHEMGVMLLVLTPCLYCNVSDSWMLPNKWHRAFIGAAGMYVEMVLASVATYIWWFSEPGLLNNLCLNVIFVCSVSTLVFNGNPLLRYDGYYILADVAEIPNLRQKATTILSHKAAEWFLGMEPVEDPFLPQRNQLFFVVFSIAAAIYRWVVVMSILWFLYKVWEPYGLQVIGQIIGLASLYGLFIYPLYKVGKFFYVPGRRDKVKPRRMYASLAGLAAILLAVFWLPFPHSVMCSLEIQPRDADPVYVEVAGILDKLVVRAGSQVHKGDVLAQLKDIDTDLKINELNGQKEQYRVKLENLRKQRFLDAQAGGEIPTVIDSLQMVEQQLAEKRADRDRMILKAPSDGTVLPPPETAKKEDPEGALSTWSGTPLEPETQGAHLQTGALLCLVGDPRRMEAVLVIDQTDLEFVKPGQNVDLKLDELPHDVLHGQIDEIANTDLKITSQRLSSKTGGSVQTKTDPQTGAERPMTAVFQARVPLDDSEKLLRIGLRGQGKVHADWLALGPRLWRWITHTFNFRL
jgi:putative peptide zinc metalloprotease protein